MGDVEELLATNAKLSREVLAAQADRVDQERRFPRNNIEALGKSGMLGLIVPREHGGAGGGIPEMSRALEQMAMACPSTAMVMLMHYAAAATVIGRGSNRMKQSVLPAMARGEHLSTLAFSEAGSGG